MKSAVMRHRKIIEEFEEKDWEKLIAVLPEKTDLWKKRLAECMIKTESERKVQVLQLLTDTQNKDLIETVISCLNTCDVSSVDRYDEIVRRIYSVEPNAESNHVFVCFIKRSKLIASQTD